MTSCFANLLPSGSSSQTVEPPPNSIMHVAQDLTLIPQRQHQPDNTQTKDLEDKISQLRQHHKTESFRRFLLSVLKIEYSVHFNSEQIHLARSMEALYF